MLSLRGAVVAIMVLAVELSATPADACSPRVCFGSLVPGPTRMVPANLPGVLWQPWESIAQEGHPPTADGLRIFDSAGATVAVDIEQVGDNFLARPQSWLQRDEQYLIATTNYCHSFDETFWDHWSLQTSSSTAAFPVDLGELQIQTPRASVRETWTNGPSAGYCLEQFDAWEADVSLAFSDSARPWRHALTLKLFVDGSRWSPGFRYGSPSRPLTDGASQTVFAVCDAASTARFGTRLSRGWHSIRMEATLPGVPGVLSTATHDVFFSCGIEPPDAGSLDARPAEDTSSDAGVRNQPKPRFEVVPDEQTGCDCQSSDLGDTSPAGLLLGAWLFMTGARWRRNRNSQPG